MKRTISLRILATLEQAQQLADMQAMFANACNAVVPYASGNKCCNRVALHHLCYYELREKFPKLGSQMVCNAVHNIAQSYKTIFSNRPKLKKEDWPKITFRQSSSVHYDRRTYSLKGDTLSLFTLQGRIRVQWEIGKFQQEYLNIATPREAELIYRKGCWYFNLALDIPDVESTVSGSVLGVDMGENNLAATSTGKLFGGGKLRHERDKYLHLRARLQGNGTKSAKQLLKKVSGRENRHVRHVNHEVSKSIVNEAIANNCNVIAMENLTNIRKRIKAGKRLRSRLHRWAWAQLQEFVEYKAQAVGIQVVYVKPAYTSKTCSQCGNIGNRNKHQFSCPFCGRLAHADLNAGLNIASLGRTAVLSTGTVNCPNVAANC